MSRKLFSVLFALGSIVSLSAASGCQHGWQAGGPIPFTVPQDQNPDVIWVARQLADLSSGDPVKWGLFACYRSKTPEEPKCFLARMAGDKESLYWPGSSANSSSRSGPSLFGSSFGDSNSSGESESNDEPDKKATPSDSKGNHAQPDSGKAGVAPGPDSAGNGPATSIDGLAFVQPGCFQMGSPSTEYGRHLEEAQHEVCITKGYYMGKTEVTQGEWMAVMGANPSYHSSCGETCPVESVSWWDTLAFLNALSKRGGLEECYELTGCRGGEGGFSCKGVTFRGLGCAGYRLPTEAEWEYAARAGSTEAQYGSLGSVAWYDENSRAKAHAVGRKAANALGLHDMLGNVWEWCWDRAGAYPNTPASDPLGASSGTERVNRGGGWYDSHMGVRAANRGKNGPDYRAKLLGFRVCRSQVQ